MKNYQIIASDEKAKTELESIIKELKLEERLHIFYRPEEPSCPLQVACRIENCHKPQESFKGRLRVYIDEKSPWVVVSGLDFVSFHPPNNGLLASIRLDKYIIEIHYKKNTT